MDGGVGATLREARNRRKLDLSEIEAELKIRVRLLRALENEEWEALPGGSYTRGFVRTYANYLGLDGERLAEEHAREGGEARREQSPRVEPDPVRAGAFSRRPRLPGWAMAALVCAALVAVLVVVGLSGGGGGGPAPSGPGGGKTAQKPPAQRPRAGPARLTLRLAALAEVWACVLDSGGRPLVDGEILSAGAEAGPFHSGSFTVSFGNGAVTMKIDGKQIPIPESSSPIGYAIAPGGRLSELSEGERPTCT